MIQEIDFKGISNSPSDHECADGELGTCLNLINEDGALKPIYATSGDDSLKLNETITDGENAGIYERTIRFVHKVTHGDEIHIHYIAQVKFTDLNDVNNNGYLWQWCEKNTGEWKSIGITDKEFNSVTAIGNVLCFVGNDNILYGYWQKDSYVIFDEDDFNFKFSAQRAYPKDALNSQNYSYSVTASMGDEFWNNVMWSAFGNESESNRLVYGINSTQLKNAFSAVDAILNDTLKNLGNEYFKYIVFGVVAVKLFDGTYVNISNVFTISPQRITDFIGFNAEDKTFSYSACISSVRMQIDSNLENIGDFIQGIDIYVTHGDTFLDFEKTCNVKSTREGTFTLSRLKNKELYKAVEDKPFFKSVSLAKEEINKPFYLKRPIGTEESLSLADFKRIRFGGGASYVYNNRLHIANINTGNINLLDYFVVWKFDTYTSIQSREPEVNQVLQKYPDLPIKDGLTTDDHEMVNAVIVVNTQTKTYYFGGKLPYPILPMISIPITGANSADIYIVKSYKYWHKKIGLYQSSNWGASFYIHTDSDGLISLLQVNDVKSEHSQSDTGGNSYALVASPNNEFEEITVQEYLLQWNLWQESTTTNKYPNLIRVSEAENPLVFPASNSVQVGSSTVKSLASNTHTISEGQFGTAPLYAFTDEGVWALITTGEGTYEARQPVNRDVVSNAEGIISTDDAVLYPTKRGIMLIQGTSSECITDVLRGKPFRFTDLFRKDFAKKVLDINGITESAVTPLDFDKFLENASMTFDYKDQRLILYNNNVDYAFVFSFRSKMWGAMECDFKYNVNLYPDSYVVTKDGKIKNIHNDEPSEGTRYLVCTRPLVFGSPEHFKTMLTTIVRGYFRNKPGKCGIVLYASNDLFNWIPIATSVDKYLRGIAGSPYKYFRVALTGSLAVEESISGFSSDIQERWQNKLR